MSSPGPSLDLVADIGGTNARFGLARAGRIERVETLLCAEHSSLGAAALSYLDRVGAERPRRAALAVAGPVEDGTVEMTNHVWTLTAEALRQELELEGVQLINDFAALALALPALADSDSRQVKPGLARPDEPMAVLGPGTGLGVAALVPNQGTWIPVTTEGGHRDLAATHEREWQVIRQLLTRFARVSVERVLSGPGLVNLYWAVARLEGAAEEDLTPQAVVARAAGGCAVCAEAVSLFSAWLGAVAGDLALTYGARGGVFLGGGMLGRMEKVFDVAAFNRRFVAKGRFRDYLEPISVRRIVHPFAALLGAARALPGAPAAS